METCLLKLVLNEKNANLTDCQKELDCHRLYQAMLVSELCRHYQMEGHSATAQGNPSNFWRT